ncbi:MAG: prolipoprotein diacylglyceryl transferase [Bacteroidales bacterium]|nr:prolipoprotein diacylglyceryl transferase [Bacteroidales bacterium]
MVISYIDWTVNPEIFNAEFTLPLVGEVQLAVRYYGVLFAMGFVLGYYIMLRFFKKEQLDVILLDQLATYMIVATIIGARLGHVLFYQPDYYFAHPSEILKIWHGGLASHGAAIGIIIALWMFAKKTKRSFLWTIDRIVVMVALAGALIRTGNLMNSEIYGKATDVPWAFVFSVTDRMEVPRHPTQIYEALAYLATFVFLYWYYHHKESKPPQGILLGWFFVLIFGFRFIVEFFKAPQVGFESDLMLNMGQILSIPFVILGVWLLRLVNNNNVPRFLKKGKA